ncbi:NAD(P)-binding protein [Hypoxylon trugodes]|uniref:NAD(P)-binding protein n=1 Tax=Hypoxylon trugodes TaxID=326681 RepID=UPI0021A11D05|nr:NAD(P)-binding protein [Hypoxylon trugodes]KAI1384514.1 NAD(P)-binding protein [Hypoxylon trugodes]
MAKSYDTNTTSDELIKDFGNEIKGKIILVTGVTPGGLGAVYAEFVSKGQPALIILASRNLENLEKVVEKINATSPGVKTRLLQLDLGSFVRVREAADAVNSWDDVPKIDVVVNNAGLMATDYFLTTDGFESQFGTNHLGHFLFTNLIMKKILASKAPRIVNITSDGHRLNPIRWDDYNFDDGKTYSKWHAYGQSKTANMLMAVSLAEKLGKRGLLAFSVHPGTVEGTSLGAYCNWEVDYPALMAADKALGNPQGWATSFTFKSQQRGVASHIFASFAPNLKEHNGKYILDSRIGDPWKDTIKPWATSSLEAERLWKLSEKLVDQEFSY